MNSSLFPPHTDDVQFNENWIFIGNKEKNCEPEDPDDDDRGNIWDQIAIDPDLSDSMCYHWKTNSRKYQ